MVERHPLAGGQLAFGAPPLSQPYVVTVVPEPGTAALLGLGLLAVGGAARLRHCTMVLLRPHYAGAEN